MTPMICEVCKKEFHKLVRPGFTTLCSMECAQKLMDDLDKVLEYMGDIAKKNPEIMYQDDDDETDDGGDQ